MRKFVMGLLALALAACSATGPKFSEAPPPPAGRALAYVYRMPAKAMAARRADFYFNDAKTVGLFSGGYSFAYLAPGETKLVQSWPDGLLLANGMETTHLIFQAKAGDVRYFRLTAASEFFPTEIELRWRIDEVPAAIARAEIAELRFTPSAR